MPNGVAALHLVLEPAPEHSSKDAPAADKPAAAPAATEIEIAIGEATAAAAVALGQGLVDFEAGGRMTPATRALSGECLGRVAQLQLDTFGEIDFAGVARAEGKRELHRRYGVTFRQHYGPNLDEVKLDAALDEIIGWALTIAEKVVADERALAH